jgi:hypothetical protein
MSFRLICLTLVLQLACAGASQAQRKPKKQTSPVDSGKILDGVYQNRNFAFTYKIPFGWVDRTDDMRPGAAGGSSPPEGNEKTGEVLLAIFERPPLAAGDTVNSAVVITAESAASYPGLKTAADYFEPLTELTKSKGFTVVNEPYEVSVGMKRLVRGDFSKQLNQNLTMRQSSLVLLSQGYLVQFTFIGSSQDETDQLISRLTFSPTLRNQP